MSIQFEKDFDTTHLKTHLTTGHLEKTFNMRTFGKIYLGNVNTVGKRLL